MTGRPVSIRIKSVQKLGKEQDETIENYSGSFVERDDASYISYTRDTENGQIKALINFSREQMTLTQKGILNARLAFIPGQTTKNDYGTPQGNLLLSVKTYDYSVKYGKGFIDIVLRYDIVFSDEPIETNMYISVKLL